MTVALVLRRVAAWMGLISALVGVFMLYTRPEFMVDLAQQVWACF